MHENHVASSHVPSGLPAIPALRWGTHVGHLSGAVDELGDILVPYFKAGLDNNESCLWVTNGSFSAATARAALLAAVPDLDVRERSGQIAILEGDAFYTAIENRQADALLYGVLQREEAAVAAGYAGLRTNGNCSWCNRHHWTEFQRYERLLQENVRNRRMIVMCSYCSDSLESDQLVDVTDRHDFVFRHAPVTAIDPAQSRASTPFPDPEPAELDFQADVETVAVISALPILLRIICGLTGMGFAAVARVTGDRWICLAAHDGIDIGLRPGGELNVETTLCREVWQSREGIVINHVASDAVYRDHRAPAMYGFQSYISMPIFLSSGMLYGTLCAIDPQPAALSTPDIIGMFRAFADLIAFHIDAAGQPERENERLLDARTAAQLRAQSIPALGRSHLDPVTPAKYQIVSECVAHLSAALSLMDRVDDPTALLAAAKLSELSHALSSAYNIRWLERSIDDI